MRCNLENVFHATTGLIDFTPITHAKHAHAHVNKCTHCIPHAQTAAERLMIFTLINSVDKACRGRIYTQDYIGLIKKKRKKEKKKQVRGKK